jgi:hypothetical protein
MADSIRHRIVHGGVNGPSKFPNGEKILKFMPRYICHSGKIDNALPSQFGGNAIANDGNSFPL